MKIIRGRHNINDDFERLIVYERKLQNNSNLCRVVIRGASRFTNLVKIYDY